MIICCVYVDDALLAYRGQQVFSEFLTKLKTRFPIDDRGTLSWLLGVSITRDRKLRTITLSQELYVTDV